MTVAAVIAEYNPFHNGHAFQLAALRRGLGGDGAVVVVMSPDFVQRGEPACLEKRLRAQAALEHGADLVVELPLPYAMASAERFAFGGVALCQAMGCVDLLCFGSEAGQLEPLLELARLLEDPALEEPLRRQLAQGRTFAQARQRALEELAGAGTAALLSQPNNTLGVEYLRQLARLGSSIRPMTLPREGTGHHDGPRGQFASASSLRRLWQEHGTEALAPYVPEGALSLYSCASQEGRRAQLSLGERCVLSGLRQKLGALQAGDLPLPDCSEGIENRLAKAVSSACSLEELAFAVKSKRYTLARVRRLIFSAWLEVPPELYFQAPPYLRILGMGPRGAEILHRMKQTASLPFGPSLAQLGRTSPQAAAFAALESRAADQWSLFCPRLRPCGLDYTLPAVYPHKR